MMEKELKHYGVLGMKWGKRNGPPYPLTSSQKSSAEKSHGSSRSHDLIEKQAHNAYDDYVYEREKIGENAPANIDDFIQSSLGGLTGDDFFILESIYANYRKGIKPHQDAVNKVYDTMKKKGLLDFNLSRKDLFNNIEQYNKKVEHDLDIINKAGADYYDKAKKYIEGGNIDALFYYPEDAAFAKKTAYAYAYFLMESDDKAKGYLSKI